MTVPCTRGHVYSIVLRLCIKKLFMYSIIYMSLTHISVSAGSYNFRCGHCNNSTITKSFFHDGDGAITMSGDYRFTINRR